MTVTKVFMDARQVVDILQDVPKRQIAVSDLIEILNANEIHSVWNIDRIKATIDYSVRRGGEYAGLSLSQGGKVIRLSSSERVGLNSGAYRDIVEAVKADGARISEIFNGLHRTVYDVHTLGRRNGAWSRPDLLIELRTRENLSRPKELHSLEFELPGHASPANVAQAYVSGRGATKSWLLFSLDDYPSTQQKRLDDFQWASTDWLAEDLGIGLIGYKRLSASGTWRIIRPAKNRSTHTESRSYLNDLIKKVKIEMQK